VRILIADDDPVARRLLERDLQQQGHSVVLAENGDVAWEILGAADAPRIAVLDWMMPGHTGPEICRMIRQRVSSAYTYLILATAREDKHDVISGLDSGADDYLTKPLDSGELLARLRVGFRILELEDNLLKAREGLVFAATHDGLTKLLNRAAIDDMLRRELARAQREHSPVSILLLDIDRFKSINDTYGHPVGDQVIREIAARFSSAIRAYDAVGRYGGEEFLAVLPGCDSQGVTEHARRVLDLIRWRTFDTTAGRLHVTASIGAASTDDVRDATPATLLHAADDALYAAKHSGRNRAITYAAVQPEPASPTLDA
jgi:two-component system, cell cycle response regulator